MIIYFGADHRGFQLKERLKAYVKDMGYEVEDLGDTRLDEKDDYSDFAAYVGRKVAAEPISSRGVVICGSGVGADITANKYAGVRSALAISTDQIFDARHDDDVNVLALAADFMEEDDAMKIVHVFLDTPFSGEERHKRRIDKISRIEYP